MVVVPPCMIGSVATLFTIITATAPAASAVSTFKVKLHAPLRITAIFPFKAAAFVNGSQASFSSVEAPALLSTASARSAVNGTSVGICTEFLVKFESNPEYPPASAPALIVKSS